MCRSSSRHGIATVTKGWTGRLIAPQHRRCVRASQRSGCPTSRGPASRGCRVPARPLRRRRHLWNTWVPHVQPGRPPARRSRRDRTDCRIPSASTCSAPCAAAARSSACPAGSTAPSWRRCACARSGRSACTGCSCPSATRRPSRSGSGAARRTPRRSETSSRTSRPRSRPPAATRGSTRPSGWCSRSTATAGGASHAAVDPRQRPPQHLDAHGAAIRRATSEPSRHAAGRLPAAGRRDQLQAARAQDDGVLPRGPADFAVAGHAEPPRVRPGLLREAGRRRRGLQADRAPLQDPGLRARRHLGRARGDPQRARRRPTPSPCRRRRRSSTSRCPTRRWTSACGRTTTACRAGEVAAALGLTAEQIERVYRDIEAEAPRHAATCTTRRS